MKKVKDAISKFPMRCPECGTVNEWGEEWDYPNMNNRLLKDKLVFVGWKCGCGWEQDCDDNDLTRSTNIFQPERIASLQARLDALDTSITRFKPFNLRQMIHYFPNGDFDWSESLHTADKVPVNDDGNWRGYRYAIGYKRVNGYLTIEDNVFDGEDWETTDSWSEDPAEDCGAWEDTDLAREIGEYRMFDFFYSWARYWLFCAEWLEDPLSEYTGKIMAAPDWVEWCLKNVEHELKYLEKRT